MPRLSSFYGMVVYMYIRDHGLPHIHVRHGDDVAVFEVETGLTLAGSLKWRQVSLVPEWIGLHRAAPRRLGRASAGEAPGTIEPLP